jgi:hypothetical protein
MGEVLGRVVSADLTSPRGPDAAHRIRVPRRWLQTGALVEIELPRNLTCASCEGGGCDACDRSGALTVRERGEPIGLLVVTLPAGDLDGAVVIPIPEYGGLPPEGSELPRGHLLLRVEPGTKADPSVTLAPDRVVEAKLPTPVVPAKSLERRPVWFLAAALAVGVMLVIWALLSQR